MINLNDEIAIDLKDYLRILSKWKWVIVLITTIAVITAVVLSWFVLPPVYQAKAVIQVIRGEQRPLAAREDQTLDEVVGALSRLPQMTINTYVNQLENQVVFQRVIDRLELDRDMYTPAGVAGMVTAQAVRDTNLIEVQVNNTDPQLAASLANTVGEEFMVFINENNQEQLGISMKLLENQMESTRKELAVAAENLRKFDVQPRSVEYLVEQMASRQTDLSDFRSQLISTEVSLQQDVAGKTRLVALLAETPPTLLTRSEVPSAEGGLNPENAAVQLVTVEEPNPAYERITQELVVREVKIVELQARKAALETAVVTLVKEINELQAELAGKRAERGRLQGSVDRLNNTYSVLADNISRTQVIRAINIGDTSLMVVAQAVIPTNPISPRKLLNVAVAFLLSLMLSTFLVFLLDFLDNTIKTPADVQRHLAMPLLGSIPLYDTLAKSTGGGKQSQEFPKNQTVPRLTGYSPVGNAPVETSVTKERRDGQ